MMSPDRHPGRGRAIGLADATAVVLAGAVAPRPVASVPSRPVEGASRSIVTRQLDRLCAAGVGRIVVCTSHTGKHIWSALGPTYRGHRLTYALEPRRLDSGGALRRALPVLIGDPLLVVRADAHVDVDFEALWARHAERRASATIVVTHVEDASRSRGVIVDHDDHVQSFVEAGEAATPGWVSAGVYVLSRVVISTTPLGVALCLEREVLPGWIGRGLYADRAARRAIETAAPAINAAPGRHRHRHRRRRRHGGSPPAMREPRTLN